MFVFDAHCDAPSQMLRLRDYASDNAAPAQVDFPKLRRGGVDASVFALYIPAALQGDAATRHAFRLLDALQAQVPAGSDTFGDAATAAGSASAGVAFATSAAEAIANKKAGHISIFTGLENGSAIQEDLRILDELRGRGVRYVTLTHSADNQVCDSCTGEGTHGGLTAFGRKLVGRMNETGVIIDLAHCADSTMAQVLDMSSAPVAYTHGCCRALSSHRRNITDALLRKLADGGGVAGMSVYPPFLSDDFRSGYDSSAHDAAEARFIADPSDAVARKAWEKEMLLLRELSRPGVERVCDHICHAVNVAGIEGVGIGTDYDGIEVTAAGLEDVSCLPLVFEALSRRGFSDDEIDRIAGGNWLRLF